jgi:hypothetical protein
MDENKKDPKSHRVVFGMGESPDEVIEKSETSALEKAVTEILHTQESLAKNDSPLQQLIKQASGNSKKRAPSLAFTEMPSPMSNFLGLFRARTRGIPPELIKEVRQTDHLIAAILRTRGNMMRLYSHLRKDRFDVGIEVEIKPEFIPILTPQQYEKLSERVKRLEIILLNCGHVEGLENHEKMTLGDYFYLQTINGLSFGSHATEIIYDRTDGDDPKFHRFRPRDMATIYRAIRRGEQVGQNLRELAIKALEAMEGINFNIDIKKLREDEYAWLQVIEGQPRQAFTHQEMLVYDMYPCTDVEFNGYPISPIHTCVNSITTHIAIESFWKTYFCSGKSAKGMLVIKSNEVDQQMLDAIKLQFNASINSVSNAFRTPIFGIAPEDQVEWVPTQDKLENGEFQFTYDQVARNILSSFGMSPDELAGYGHLSKGTNSQSLSESSNEFKLTAARDSGLRPLVLGWQTFLNQRLLPLIDPELAQLVEIRLKGLDTSTRLQQDSVLFHTYDSLLGEVDRHGPGKMFGDQVPFNERYRQVMDFYSDVSEIRSKFYGDPGALIDPLLKFKRDAFYLQFLQLLMQVEPNILRAQFVPKPHSLEFLKMEAQDLLDDDGTMEN